MPLMIARRAGAERALHRRGSVLGFVAKGCDEALLGQQDELLEGRGLLERNVSLELVVGGLPVGEDALAPKISLLRR
jgi:hypothetical protein